MTLEIGQVVENRYRISDLLGQGGMGAVYRAWDNRLNRSVALKEMIPQPGLDSEMLSAFRQQFKHEAQILATLSHPSLVRVTDYFSWDGNEYLVMDFVEGESLADRIEQRGPQSETQVVEWMGQLLGVLAYCHQRGVLHRDIKPQNIVITPEGRAVLVDFGLVKLWNPDDPQTRTVMRGAGTPEYAPPEQYDMGLGHTDPRSDIYSLGATAYHALTGQTPPTATQRMATPSSFVPPRSINVALTPRVESAILKAMEVSMERRFQSAEEMTQALHPSAAPAHSATRRTGPTPTVVLSGQEPRVEPAPQPKKRRAGLWIGLAAAAVLCLVVGIGGGAALLLSGREPTPTAVASVDQPTVTAAVLDTPSPAPPTMTPSPIPVVDGPPGAFLFRDDFSDPNSGWEVGDYNEGSVGYRDGAYFVVASEKTKNMWGVANQRFSDVAVDVDATQVSAPTNDNNAYGVICRVQPNGDGYILQISGDGGYAIHRIVDGAFRPLVDWASSPDVRQGNATNHIRAVCDGSHLALYVNGELLGEADDATYAEGDVALAATTFEEERTEVHFDNLDVTTPSGEPAPSPVLYQDNFDDPNSGWEVADYEEGETGYGEGVYYVTSETETKMVWGVASQSFSDTAIEVDATQISAGPENNNAYGVMCRTQADNDAYLLRVSGDGFYAIHRIVEGEFEPLVDWTRSPLVEQGEATNHIRAVCDGTRLALYVNGELLAEAQDATYAEGDIGLTATTFEPEATEVHFDNLVVLPPEGQAPPDQVLLQDDFSNPDSGWEVGDYVNGSVGYVDGQYFVQASEPGKVMWGVAYQDFPGVVVEVETTQISAPSNDNNAYGVKCHLQPDDDGYSLQISGDGAYAIHRIVGGSFEPLVDWSPSSVIRQGNATNQLRVVCDRGLLALFANGELLAEVEDSSFSGGDIALEAVTFEDEPTEIRFDNLIVRRPLP